MINEEINKNNKKIKNLLTDFSNHNTIIINNNIKDANNAKNIDASKWEKKDKLNDNKINNNKNISFNPNNIEERNLYFNKKNNLLKYIESKDVIENLFSCLNEKTKLKTIKYNKYLKDSINIKLINYKFLSGKYVIYEKNWKGKEYSGYFDICIFEGEYSNGQRNGKGKEFNYSGKLLFEGEYLNGQRNGKGKEYYSNGKLKFEGEYLNGERLNGNLYTLISIAIDFYSHTINIFLTNSSLLYEHKINIKIFIKY